MTTKNVKVIEPTVPHIKDSRIIRAAAYCRVSTDSADQINSFSAQLKYYADYIKCNPQMEFVDIYADEGITGTSVQKRPEFKRMMKDAECGKIDRIFVKSVSRFARNSLECLENIRLLTSYGVSVLFENDNIDTKTMNSELILYVKSAFAQSEALAGSKRMSTAIRMKMENGEFITCTAPYGYKLDKERHLLIIPEEAEVIKKIFNLYLSGSGITRIAEILNNDSTNSNSICWNNKRIYYILTNEKYIGDSLCQKSYTPEILPLKKKRNHGERNKYYITNSHQAIISKDVFAIVQERLKRTQKSNAIPKNNIVLSGLIRCGKCGRLYKRIEQKGIIYWVCPQKSVSGVSCLGPNIRESDIFSAFIFVYNKLRAFQKDMLDRTIKDVTNVKERLYCQNKEIAQIDTEIAMLCDRNCTYNELHGKGIIDDVSYLERTSELKFKISELRQKRIKLLNNNADEMILENLIKLKDILDESPKIILDFDQVLFSSITDKITVAHDYTLTFNIKGLKLQANLSEVKK